MWVPSILWCIMLYIVQKTKHASIKHIHNQNTIFLKLLRYYFVWAFKVQILKKIVQLKFMFVLQCEVFKNISILINRRGFLEVVFAET